MQLMTNAMLQKVLRVMLIGAMALCAGIAWAQARFPTKPIRMINPFPPGGPVDVVGRPVLEKLRVALGQPVLMDYRPGGGTIIGSELMVRAEPDGHTLLFTAAQHAINPALYAKLPYDTAKDFIPVAIVATGPLLLAVSPSVPANNVRELIALARARPGRLNYGSAGNGSGFHMAGEMFKLMAGVDIVHVPYKGGAPVTADLVAGQIDMAFSSVVAVLPHIRAGRLRGLAVTTPARSLLVPDIPSIDEAGVPGFDADTWYGIFAPAGTPHETVNLLHREIERILNEAQIRELFARVGVEPGMATSEQFAARVARDMAKWAKVAKESGAKVD